MNLLKNINTNTKNISSVESFNLWSALNVRYTSIEKHQLYLNLVHDKDFIYLLNKNIKQFKEEVSYFEEKAKTHQVKVPGKPAAEIKFTAQLDPITDKMIFRQIISDLEYELNGLIRATVSSITTDDFRSNLIKIIINHLHTYERFYRYGKLKGWAEVVPAYKVKPGKKEDLSVSEANHIWDHINLRYDQRQLTDIFLDFVYDIDLQGILRIGDTVLDDQIKLLEKIAVKFEVPLPERPSAVIQSTIDPEIIEDKFVYRLILAHIQSAIGLHIRAVVETTRNDKLRDTFFQFLEDEFSIFDKLLKYGKMKGWTHIAPMYRVGS